MQHHHFVLIVEEVHQKVDKGCKFYNESLQCGEACPVGEEFERLHEVHHPPKNQAQKPCDHGVSSRVDARPDRADVIVECFELRTPSKQGLN